MDGVYDFLKKEIKNCYYSLEEDVNESDDWEEIENKNIIDSDGFATKYTLYKNILGYYICIYGDRELYPPSSTDADYSTDSMEEAYSWFDNYKGEEI